MTIWMEVTQDEYELPVLIALTAGELARKAGVRTNNVSSSACKNKHGRCKQTRFLKVEIDDGEEL